MVAVHVVNNDVVCVVNWHTAEHITFACGQFPFFYPANPYTYSSILPQPTVPTHTFVSLYFSPNPYNPLVLPKPVYISLDLSPKPFSFYLYSSLFPNCLTATHTFSPYKCRPTRAP